jgi:hypothetical protein
LNFYIIVNITLKSYYTQYLKEIANRMKLIKNIATNNCILNIYVEDDTGCNQYIFDAEDLKTAYVYKKIYTYEYLVENFKIISIYPNLFDQMCDKIIPKISIDQEKKYCNVQWDIEIPFNKESLLLQIPEHTFEGQNNELISLQRSNKLLIQKTKRMEEDIKRLNMLVNLSLETQIPKIFNDNKLIEILFTADSSLKEHYTLNYMVRNYILRIDACEKKLNCLRELIRCGYSITLPNQKYRTTLLSIDSAFSDDIPINPRSIYSIFVSENLTNSTEEQYQKFKIITEIILPTADLNQMYPDKETIMAKLMRDISAMPSNANNNGRRMMEYLRSIGAR